MEFRRRTEQKEVFLFDTETAALAAVAIVNEGEGIPVDENAATQTYTTPVAYNGQWYIVCDDVTKKYLEDAVIIES